MKQTKSGKELLNLSNSLIFKIWEVQEKIYEIQEDRELNFVESELNYILDIIYDIVSRAEILQAKEHQIFINQFADKIISQIREKIKNN
jgi:hypothetical protein